MYRAVNFLHKTMPSGQYKTRSIQSAIHAGLQVWKEPINVRLLTVCPNSTDASVALGEEMAMQKDDNRQSGVNHHASSKAEPDQPGPRGGPQIWSGEETPRTSSPKLETAQGEDIDDGAEETVTWEATYEDDGDLESAQVEATDCDHPSKPKTQTQYRAHSPPV